MPLEEKNQDSRKTKAPKMVEDVAEIIPDDRQYFREVHHVEKKLIFKRKKIFVWLSCCCDCYE